MGDQTIAAQIQHGARLLEQVGVDTPRLDAELLLASALGVTRSYLYAHPEQPIPVESARVWLHNLQRRLRREPLAYILGKTEFYGLELVVTPDVLVPRPETEALVEAVLTKKPQRMADIGTGSGCIAVAVAVKLPQVHVWATDISESALRITAENAQRHGVAERIHLLHGDLLQPLAGMRFDVIASNPPYVAQEQRLSLQPEVRDWEPPQALFTRDDPLHFHRRLAAESHFLLNQGGWLVLEVGMGQAESVRQLLCEAGYSSIGIHYDLAGIGRVVEGQYTPCDKGVR